MSRLSMVLMIGALCAPHAVRAQSCTPAEHPYFQFQVERPAKFIGDTAARPRPRVSPPSPHEEGTVPLVVAFIVDSAGVVQKNTLRILQSGSEVESHSMHSVFANWKYSPAEVGGCRVAQLVQTEVEP